MTSSKGCLEACSRELLRDPRDPSSFELCVGASAGLTDTRYRVWSLPISSTCAGMAVLAAPGMTSDAAGLHREQNSLVNVGL